jgi:Spy/CpxP family protein refolding chaperone
MKRDGLLYLVIFSLALNVGAIGTFAYLRYRDRQAAAVKEELPPLPFREMWRSLNLDQEQRQTLRQLVPEHRRRVRTLRGELAEKRRELFTLLRSSDSPAWPAVQAKIREVSELQGKLEEEVIQHLLTVQKQLKPEQKAIFAHLLEQRLRPFQERMGGPMGMGPRRGRHGSPGGMHRGPGPGGPPPPTEEGK